MPFPCLHYTGESCETNQKEKCHKFAKYQNTFKTATNKIVSLRFPRITIAHKHLPWYEEHAIYAAMSSQYMGASQIINGVSPRCDPMCRWSFLQDSGRQKTWGICLGVCCRVCFAITSKILALLKVGHTKENNHTSHHTLQVQDTLR